MKKEINGYLKKVRVTKQMLEIENKQLSDSLFGANQTIAIQRNEIDSLRKLPLNQALVTLSIALEKTTESVAHVLSDLKRR